MPCDSSYLEPRAEERTSVALYSFLTEVGLRPKEEYDYNYGNTQFLDRDTRTLCEWCKAHPDEVRTKSFELQIWWRDHQEADKKRERQEQLQEEKELLRRSAKAKLTAAELKALKED